MFQKHKVFYKGRHILVKCLPFELSIASSKVTEFSFIMVKLSMNKIIGGRDNVS